MLKQVQKHLLEQTQDHYSGNLESGEVQLYHLSTILFFECCFKVHCCLLTFHVRSPGKNDTHKYSTAVDAFD